MSTNRHAAAQRHLSRRCPVMKSVIQKVGPCRLEPDSGDPFALIVRCIIGQQISGKAAASIFAKLEQGVGSLTPRRLAKFPEDSLQACGLSGGKRRAIRSVTDFVLANRKFLPGIPTAADEDLRKALVALNGIGPWTVDMFMMFGLGRADVLATGDYGIRVGLQKLFALESLPKPAEMERLAEPWRPHRSVAMWYVWRHLDWEKQQAKTKAKSG
jgi:DNA-3-methyladenine glycosylase II